MVGEAPRGAAVVEVWDAETQAGRSCTIPADVAVDGIDEFLSDLLPNPLDGAAPIDGSVHIHTTDEDVHGEWLIVEGADGLVVTREHAKGSCALRGPAGDVLLVLWRRLPLDRIDVVGDAEVAARFVARTDLG